MVFNLYVYQKANVGVGTVTQQQFKQRVLHVSNHGRSLKILDSNVCEHHGLYQLQFQFEYNTANKLGSFFNCGSI